MLNYNSYIIMFYIFQRIMKLYIIITTLSFLCIESGIQFAVGSPMSNRYMNEPNQFCGQALADELAILCKGRYNEPKGNNYFVLFYKI